MSTDATITEHETALTIDKGWREVAETAMAFVQRFTQPQRAAGS